jgi:hypothetical protein
MPADRLQQSRPPNINFRSIMNKIRLLAQPSLAALLALILVLGSGASRTRLVAQQSGSKDSLTPTFWQRDPDANFEDEGRMHCAPTSVADGLIYLTKAFGLKGLVPGSNHESQIKLIQELAEEFGTDPSIGGTNPDKILTGLRSYSEARGYELTRLELKTWRGVSKDNKEFKIGTRPDMAWMRAAANSKDMVVVFNFGWYRETDDGYERKGGHWVNVVGASGKEFTVHNPILKPEQQSQDKSVELTMLDEDFIVQKDSGEANMKGYYEGNGPGLPHGEKVTAILDSVIVFSLKKQ